MTDREIAKLLTQKRVLVKGRRSEGFVLLPISQYQLLLEALEDARDLIDLRKARARNSGDRPVPLSEIAKPLSHKPAASIRARKPKRVA